MRRRTVDTLIAILLLVLPIALFIGCSRSAADEEQASTVEEGAAADEIPITTTSEEARDLYIQGRDLAEKLRPLDARPLLEQAVQKDPSFAAAYFLLATTAPSNEEFFSNLEKAMANVANASEGERLTIQATQAGVDGRADEQLALLRQLVEKYPGDERAHNLLGNQLFFARQEYDPAIAEYKRAVEINPQFGAAWNSMGYAARAAGRFDEAEQAFRRYIEVLPNEPNPVDSYAEFLMKQGRFDESIVQYRRALEIDSTFTASDVGIANNQMFLGQNDAARQTLDALYAKAPNDGVRRQALLWKAASYFHEGNRGQAMQVLEERRGIAEKTSDGLSVANDDVLIGRTLLDTGDADKAERLFAEAIATVEKAQTPEEIKEGLRRNHLYNEALVALARGDLAAAREKAAAYHERVQSPNIAFEIRQDHELMGRIALADGKATEARTHFGLANNQDPRVLVLIATAENSAGNAAAAQEMARQAAEFNQLSFPLSYVRAEARQMVGA
jgi:tetratricopeptide (TPR) repeat protein